MLLSALQRNNVVKRMGRGLGVGGVVVVAFAISATAVLAGPKCARPDEVTAIQAAAVQQQLMVAALYCNDTSSYNAFQTSYNKELNKSDKALLSMFRRLYGWRKGDDEYNAFKTRLANDSSLRSIHDHAGYCGEASSVFAAALAPQKPMLADFVSGVKIYEQSPVDSCEIRVAPGLREAGIAPGILPRPNPLRVAALSPAPTVSAPSAAPTVAATPASSEASAQATAQTPAEAPAQASSAQSQATAEKPAQTAKKHGWLSHLFN